MKRLNEYIMESQYPDLANDFIKELRKVGIKNDIKEYGDRSELRIARQGISLRFKNGKSSTRIPGALYASSQFENEPVYIAILDNLDKDNILKSFFDGLMDASLQEATNGKNAQWGTWKFAIKSKDDIKTVMKLLKKNYII